MTIDRDDFEAVLARTNKKNPLAAREQGLRKSGVSKSVTGREQRRLIERARRSGIDTLGRDEIFHESMTGQHGYGGMTYNDRQKDRKKRTRRNKK